MSHLQALISRNIVHIVLQFLCLTVFLCLSRTIAIGIPLCITKPGLSPGFVMHKGIPIATVRLRHKKTVRHKNCKTICTIFLEINA